MTPADLDALLTVARKHGVLRLKIGGLKIDGEPGMLEVDMVATPPREVEQPAAPAKVPANAEEHWQAVSAEMFGS